jgi:hypothetical protein
VPNVMTSFNGWLSFIRFFSFQGKKRPRRRP